MEETTVISFLKYIFSKTIFKRIIHIFFYSDEGFLFHAKNAFKIFFLYGLDGLRKELNAYPYERYRKPVIPDKDWYSNYLKNVPCSEQLLTKTKKLDIFLSEDIPFDNQIKQPLSSIENADYILLVSKNTKLEPIALLRVAQAAIETQADLIYGDEIIISNDEDWSIVARPAFSLDLFLYKPDLGSIIAVKKSVYLELYPEHDAKAPSTDIICNLLKHCQTITHIPDILCRSCGSQKVNHELSMRSVTSYINYEGIDAVVAGHDNIGNDVRFRLKRKWKAAIIIPTKNHGDILKKCISFIEKTCDSDRFELIVVDNGSDEIETLNYLDFLRRNNHTVILYNEAFNYSIINNIAVEASSKESDYFVFMNNDIEVLTQDWLIRLVEDVNRKDVGIVGPLLVYPDMNVQHAGVITSFCGGLANHVSKYVPAYLDDERTKRNPGYDNYLTAKRDYSAITGACVAMRRTVFEQIGGFDEKFRVGLNDIDLCLRVRELGLKVLYNGSIVMVHHESYSRSSTSDIKHPEDNDLFKKKYAGLLEKTDIWFNPLLSTEHYEHTPKENLVSKVKVDFRTVKIH